MPIGSIIAAGANILGGIMGKQSADAARHSQEQIAAQNIALQREFAQNGIQWKVEDAKKAGIHPIYALGGSTHSFAPVSAAFSADNSMASAMSAAGQDIGRAISATSTSSQRQDAFTRASQALTLERGQLENEVLRSQLASQNARLRSPGSPPMAAAADPYLLPGQTQSGLTTTEPLKVTPAPSNAPHSEGGAIVDVGYARTPTGWVPVPSKDVKERTEDNLPHEWSHFMRNNIFPMIPGAGTPPPFSPPAGKVWRYNPLKLEWQQVRDRTHYLKGVGRAISRAVYGGPR